MDLLERAPAVEDLSRWLAEAGAGQGRLILVSGEAGIGKTSLLDGATGNERAAASVMVTLTTRPAEGRHDVCLLPGPAPRCDQFLGW